MTPNTQSDDRLMPLDEVRTRLGNISRASIYRIIGEGRLPIVKLGRRTLVRNTDLQKFMVSAGGSR